MMNWRIPLADVNIDEEEKAAVQAVLDSGWLTMGAQTKAFEEVFAAYVGARHAIAVANGTAALHLACLALGLGAGDEVVLPSLTFVATAASVLYTGARPIFADIVGEKDLNISPTSIADRITDATRAIIVVHYGGFPCDMDTILKIAGDHDLAVIEDAAHAPGAQLNGRKLGTWGVIGCFSFFSNKNLVTGEGGMVVTEDDSLAEKLRLLRSHGMTSLTWDRHRGHAWSYEVVECGYNYRIDEIRAAIGQVQLQKLEENNNRRRSLTDLYHQNLREMVPEVTIPFQKYRGLSSCHIYPLLLPGGTNRVQFMEQMKVRGIQTSIHYPPIHRFKYYRTDPNLVPSHPLPWTDNVSAREVTLPLYPTLDPSELDFVVRSVWESLSEV